MAISTDPLYPLLDRLLTLLALVRKRISYRDLARAIGIHWRDPRLGRLLGVSMRADLAAGKPLRCSLVVRQAKGRLWHPGPGFYAFAAQMGVPILSGTLATLHLQEWRKLGFRP